MQNAVCSSRLLQPGPGVSVTRGDEDDVPTRPASRTSQPPYALWTSTAFVSPGAASYLSVTEAR